MRAHARGVGDRDADVQREQPLREIVGLARIGLQQIAQRPLQEQQQRDRQYQDARRSYRSQNSIKQRHQVLRRGSAAPIAMNTPPHTWLKRRPTRRSHGLMR